MCVEIELATPTGGLCVVFMLGPFALSFWKAESLPLEVPHTHTVSSGASMFLHLELRPLQIKWGSE